MLSQFSWLSYLDVAELLVHQRGPGYYRSAVSRAYYGVLIHSRDTLQQLGGITFSIGREIHHEVISALQNDPRLGVAELGEKLNELRMERNRADYRTNVPFPANRARSALAEARRIRDGIAVFFPSS